MLKSSLESKDDTNYSNKRTYFKLQSIEIIIEIYYFQEQIYIFYAVTPLLDICWMLIEFFEILG